MFLQLYAHTPARMYTNTHLDTVSFVSVTLSKAEGEEKRHRKDKSSRSKTANRSSATVNVIINTSMGSSSSSSSSSSGSSNGSTSLSSDLEPSGKKRSNTCSCGKIKVSAETNIIVDESNFYRRPFSCLVHSLCAQAPNNTHPHARLHTAGRSWGANLQCHLPLYCVPEDVCSPYVLGKIECILHDRFFLTTYY